VRCLGAGEIGHQCGSAHGYLNLDVSSRHRCRSGSIRKPWDNLPATMLEMRTLGRTGVEVSILGYGALGIGGQSWAPAIEDGQTESILNAVLDSGINLIDTSIEYGRSEELIGRFIRHRREEFLLASKCGCLLGDPPKGATPPFPHDYSASNIRAGLEQSLKRLKTDYLDLLQVHRSPSRRQMDLDGTVEALLTLRDEGFVRFIGMSGTLPHLPVQMAMGVFDVFQIPYSAVQREHENLIAAAADAGAGTLIRGGVARGVLSEHQDGRQGPFGLEEGEAQKRWESSGVEELLGGMSRIEFLLRFTLSHPGLSSAIIGTTSLHHLKANVAIAERGALPPDLYSAAKSSLTQGTH